METTPLHSCPDCGRVYNPKVLKKCPVCQTPYLFDPSRVKSATETSKAKKSDEVTVSQHSNVEKSSPQRDHFGRRAASSAKAVELYGHVIQIIGYIYAAILALFLIFYVGPAIGNRLVGVLLGIVIGGVTAGIAHVSGALYRMIANYILFKTA